MNAIVTLKRLVELVAKEAGCEHNEAESFIKAFTAQVRDGLAEGEAVTVKGIGTFAVDNGKIVCRIDSELAEAVNEPFAMFAPEELPAGMDEDSLKNPAALMPEATPEKAPEEAKPELEPEQPEAVEEELPVAELPAEEPVLPAVENEAPAPNVTPAPAAKEEPTPEPEPEPIADDESEDAEPVDARPSLFWIVWAAVIGLIVGFVLGFLIHDPVERLIEPSLAEEQGREVVEDESEEHADTAAVVEVIDSIAADSAKVEEAPVVVEEPKAPIVEEKPVAEESTDKIRTGYTLAKMAKKHYGANEYWVYIYYENQDRIKNPNRIEIGTELRIPPIEKYATQATEEERRAAARRKVGEVLAKFPN